MYVCMYVCMYMHTYTHISMMLNFQVQQLLEIAIILKANLGITLDYRIELSYKQTIRRYNDQSALKDSTNPLRDLIANALT